MRDSRGARKIVGKDLVSECHHLARLREEAVASDVEEEAFVGDGPADSADIMLVLFDDEFSPRLRAEKQPRGNKRGKNRGRFATGFAIGQKQITLAHTD
jgi:hypothetical protein